MKGKKLKQILSMAVVSTVLGNLVNATVFNKSVQAVSIDRVGADNRYSTSSRLAKDVFGSARVAVLVSGKGYQDAVSASPLAKQLNAPILLTYGSRLEPEVADTLKSLGVRDVYIVGGTGVISSTVENDLRNVGCYTHRIGGNNKFDTNLKIAEEVIKRSGQNTALLANGDLGYPDAISAAAVAANLGYPLLLTSSNKVPENIKGFIKNKSLEVLAVGGSGVIPDKTLSSVNGRRVAAGSDRFDTNLKLLNYFKSNLNFEQVFVSCGGNDKKNMFADALIASAAAAKTSSPVVLSGLGATESQIYNANRFIKNNANKNTKIKIVGGEAVVPSKIRNDIQNMFVTSEPVIVGSDLPYSKKFVVIGDKAYSMNYYITHTDKINSDLKKGTGILYYCYKEGTSNRILNPNHKEFKTEQDLMKECGKVIKFYDSYTEKKYIYNGSTFKEEKLTTPRYNAYIKSSNMVDKKIISVTLDNALKEDIPGAKYFQIKGSPYIKTIDGGEQIQCMLPKDINNRFNAEIWILDDSKRIIAKGEVDLTAYANDVETSFKIDFQLVNTNTLNNSGNIVNGGMAVQKGDYIYYNNTGDGNKLYKMAIDGSYNRAMGLHDARYINAFENTIIYSNYKDNFGLYKVNDDGLNLEKICDHRATYVNVIGDYIYYSNHSDGGKIYRIKINKSENGIYFGQPEMICSDTSEYLNVVGNIIYYSNYSDGHKLYAVNVNGTGRVKLNNESSNFVNVASNYIYYLTNAGVLKRMGTDGTVPTENILDQNVKAINIAEDYIYYVNGSDGNKIYRMNRNSLFKEKVCDDSAEFINVIGNFLDVNDQSISISGENIFYTKSNKLYNFDLKQAISSGKKSGQAVNKVNNTLKVSKVYDIEKTVESWDIDRSSKYIEDKYLPDRVSVLMSDDTVRELIVIWDKDKVTNSNGERTYNGEVIGYDVKAKIKLNLMSKSLNPGQITIINNTAATDFLTVTALKDGDNVKVYGKSDRTEYIASGRASANGIVQINLGSNRLDSHGGTVWVTISSSTQSTATGESTPIPVNYEAEGPQVPVSISAFDKDNSNFGVDGRDIYASWNQPDNSVVKQYIYVLKNTPDNFKVDYNMHNPLAIIYDNRTTTWTGNYSLKQDSAGYQLTPGEYNVFVIFENAQGKKSSPKYTTMTIKAEGINTVKVTGCYFKNSSLDMTIGEVKIPEVVITPDGVTNKNYYLESYNDKIVRVEGKNIRALSQGTTTIKMITEDGNYEAVCTISVGVPNITTVKSVRLNVSSLNLKIGENVQLNAITEPENVPNPYMNIVWESNNNSVVKVNSIGTVTAVGKGRAEIKAIVQDTGIYTTCVVNVE